MYIGAKLCWRQPASKISGVRHSLLSLLYRGGIVETLSCVLGRGKNIHSKNIFKVFFVSYIIFSVLLKTRENPHA